MFLFLAVKGAMRNLGLVICGDEKAFSIEDEFKLLEENEDDTPVSAENTYINVLEDDERVSDKQMAELQAMKCKCNIG